MKRPKRSKREREFESIAHTSEQHREMATIPKCDLKYEITF
jgi:hypothetical protein